MSIPNPQTEPLFEAVARVIENRKTLKVLGDPNAPLTISAAEAVIGDRQVQDALQRAGMAPFHYDRGVETIAEPWRAHVLTHVCCRSLAKQLPDWLDIGASAGKLAAMLAACGSLVIVTWLPQFRQAADTKPEQWDVDDEHLAAASAMVQSLLLLLTARGMGTYWSSGGVLKLPAVQQRLGIPPEEKLLAAVFVEYPETMSIDVERKPGKHRASRSSRWIRQVHFSS